jgi:hypothetical protein
MSSFIQGFDLIIQDIDGFVWPLANHSITVYNETISASLASITSDSFGHVPNTVISASPGETIRLTAAGYSTEFRRITASTELELIDEKLSFVAESLFTPDPVESVEGEIWIQDLTKGTDPVYFGKFKAGTTIKIPMKLTEDKDLKIFLNSIDANGNKTTFKLAEMDNQTINVRLEPVPVLGQISAATNTFVEIGVSNFTDAAKFRKIQTCENNAFTGASLVEAVQSAADYTNNKLPVNFFATRAANAISETIYVRVAHSTESTIYTAFSNIIVSTFADSSGGGGSGGGFDPDPDYGFNV